MGELGAADKSGPVNYVVLHYSDVVCKKVPGLGPYALVYVVSVFQIILRDSLLHSALVVGLASHGPYIGAILPT